MNIVFNRFIQLLNGAAHILVTIAMVDFLLHPLAGDYTFQSPLFRAVEILVLTPLTILVGWLIIRRVPGNIVGHLLIVWSVSVAINSLRADIGLIPLTLFMTYNIIFGWLALFLLFLYFPDGKLVLPVSARWIYGWTVMMMIVACLTVLSMATFRTPSLTANPLFQPFLKPYEDLILRFGLLLAAGPFLMLTLISQVLRFKRGTPLERQQIKWLALFGGACILYTLLGLIAIPLLTGGQTMNPGSNLFGMLFFLITGLFPPFAIGLAVLRYRLWEIDRIIRRTLVYSILTVTLSLVYFGLVVLLQTLSTSIFGLTSSSAAIVLSTLTIAALSAPLRRRIQQAIDRQFYRQKYDAEKVIHAFNTTVRNETNLDSLVAAIFVAVNDTMQPGQISLQIARQSKAAQHAEGPSAPVS